MKQEINQMSETETGRHVLAAVAAVMQEVDSIAKSGRGPSNQGGYAFRKADDVVNDLGAAFRKHQLFLQSRIIDVDHTTQVVEGVDGRGNPKTTTWCRCTLIAEYHVTSLVDGSELIAQATGEGLDQSDKASNKAMTAALKYALTQSFMITTEDALRDGDAEAPMIDTPAARAVRERRAQEQGTRQPPAAPAAPEGTPMVEPPFEAATPATAQPEPQSGHDVTKANTEANATRALTEATKQWTQAAGRDQVPAFEAPQLERANKAQQAAIKGDRYAINRIILAAKAEGILLAQIDGTPLYALLMSLREVAR